MPEQTGGAQPLPDDCYPPNLSAPEVPALGIWDQRRRKYLLKHKHGIYAAFLLGGKLGNHLAEIDQL